ncbi:MAG TPA: Yip1 family protein [bacterium]
MEKVVARIKNILMNPEAALDELKSESMNITTVMKEYVAIAAVVPGAAMFIGLIGNAPLFRALLYGALIYAICVAGVLGFGKLLDALAPHFGSTKNDESAFKVSLAAFTPSFVAGIVNINPNLSFLWVLGSLYGCYIVYLGLPKLMNTPEDKRIAYSAASCAAIGIVVFILWRVAKGIALGDFSYSFSY